MDSIVKFCEHIEKSQIEVVYRKKDNSKYWDLPRCVSICHDKSFKKSQRGYSGQYSAISKLKWSGSLGKKIKKIKMLKVEEYKLLKEEEYLKKKEKELKTDGNKKTDLKKIVLLKQRIELCKHWRKKLQRRDVHTILKQCNYKKCPFFKAGGCEKITCKNDPGRCAEQSAANNYMSYYGEKNLKNLFFTETLRTRTRQVIPPCGNCLYIFPNL